MKKATQFARSKGILKSLALSGCLFLLGSTSALAQGTVQCPPNVDFENGDFTNWQAWTGTAASGTTANYRVQFTNPVLSGPVAGRHTLMTTTLPATLDIYGGFPVTPPGGGGYAVRIGEPDEPGLTSERIRYYVRVPPGFNDYSFNYRFATVMQDPDFGQVDSTVWSHKLFDRPGFHIEAFDSATGQPIPCATQTYIATPQLVQAYGFKEVPNSGGVIYLPWTSGAIPIIGQGGKTIIIQVQADDCGFSGHWAYGYFDVLSCGKYKAAVTYCNLDSGIIRFIGTGITQVYNWYTSNWTFIGQGAFIDAPVPSTPDFFYGVLANGSPGCLDTIVTDTVSNFLLNTVPKTPCVQFGNPIQLSTTPVGGLGPFGYSWSGYQAAGLSCTDCSNPVASPIDTTIYYVSVVDRVGCIRKDTVEVFQAPNAGPDIAVCPLGERPAQLHVAGPPGANFSWYEYGTNSPGQYLDCTDCTDPVSAPVVPVYTYTVGYEGCPVLDTITVYHDTTNYIVAPQDLLLVCRPGYENLLSQAYGPNPKANIPCGTGNPILCAPADQLTANVGNIGTPAKNIKNTPFNTQAVFAKYQFIIKKSEMLGAGIYSGTLNSMAFHALASVVGAKAPISYMTISMGCIDKETFPMPINNNSFYQGVQMTTVANVVGYTITPSGWNTIPFDEPYSWDTTKNLVIDLCVGPLSLLDTSIIGVDPVSMVEGRSIQRMSNSINVCGGNATSVAEYLQRPAVQFNYCPTPDLPFEYTWMPGNNLSDSTIQNPTAYIGRSINYTVNSVGRNGCKIRDSLHIYMPDHDVLAGPVDTSICEGQPAFLFARGGEAYKWYEVREGAFQDASGSLNCVDCDAVVATPKETTTYAIVFSNETTVGNPNNPGYGIGCPDTLLIKVNVWKNPDVRVLNNDTTITIGQSVQLYAQGAQHFSWSPVGTLSDPNAPMTLATPTQTTTYIATGFDMNGCAYRDAVKVTVNYHGNLLIPSGFTPNGDGMNDVFKIVNPRVQALQEFRVFNRWGQEIFSTTNINAGWDGTWKGVEQDMGTYQYIIRVGYADGLTELYKGDVQLVR